MTTTYLQKEDTGYLLQEDGGRLVLAHDNTIDLSNGIPARARDCWPNLAAIKSRLNITTTTEDAWITNKRLAIIAMIETYTHRVFCYGTYLEKFDIDSRTFIPAAQPVESVVSSTTTSGNLSYNLRADGVINVCRGCGVGTITYVGGFHNIPEDVLEAFWGMMAYHHSQQGTTPSTAGQVKKESVIGVYSVEYQVDSGSSTAKTSNDPGAADYYAGLLDSYILMEA